MGLLEETRKTEEQRLIDKAYNRMWVQIFIVWAVAFIFLFSLFATGSTGAIPALLFLLVIGSLASAFFKKRYGEEIDKVKERKPEVEDKG